MPDDDASEQQRSEQASDPGDAGVVEAVDVESGGYRGPDPEEDIKGDGSDEDQGT